MHRLSLDKQEQPIALMCSSDFLFELVSATSSVKYYTANWAAGLRRSTAATTDYLRKPFSTTVWISAIVYAINLSPMILDYVVKPITFAFHPLATRHIHSLPHIATNQHAQNCRCVKHAQALIVLHARDEVILSWPGKYSWIMHHFESERNDKIPQNLLGERKFSKSGQKVNIRNVTL